MKTIKIILLLTIISLFASIPYGVAKAADCSDPKGFHAKMMCTLSGKSSTSKEKKSNPNSFWNKIKNFGGKNVGEAG